MSEALLSMNDSNKQFMFFEKAIDHSIFIPFSFQKRRSVENDLI